ncbi:MAG: hypothetical protein ACI841_005026, partial [Planctomycetota bacterium]
MLTDSSVDDAKTGLKIIKKTSGKGSDDQEGEAAWATQVEEGVGLPLPRDGREHLLSIHCARR